MKIKMIAEIDALDQNILARLQRGGSQSLDEITRKVGPSKVPLWNQTRKLFYDPNTTAQYLE